MTDNSDKKTRKIILQEINTPGLSKKGRRRVLQRHLFNINNWDSKYAIKEWLVSQEDFFIAIDSLWDISKEKCIKKVFSSTDPVIKAYLIYKMYTANVLKDHLQMLASKGIIKTAIDEFYTALTQATKKEYKLSIIRNSVTSNTLGVTNTESLNKLKQEITSQNITQEGQFRVLKRHLFNIYDWNSDLAVKEWSISKEQFFKVIDSLWDISNEKCIEKIFSSTDPEIKAYLVYKIYTSDILNYYWEKLSSLGIISVSLEDFCSVLNKANNAQLKIKAICNLINTAAPPNQQKDPSIIIPKYAQFIVNQIDYNTDEITQKLDYVISLIEKELGPAKISSAKPESRVQREKRERIKRQKERQKRLLYLERKKANENSESN